MFLDHGWPGIPFPTDLTALESIEQQSLYTTKFGCTCMY